MLTQQITKGKRIVRIVERIAEEVFNDLKDCASSPEVHTGVRTGFAELDELLGGFKPGELVVIGSRPSVGKTSSALTIARNASQIGTTVVFFSLESPQKHIYRRLWTAESQVPTQKLDSGHLNDKEWGRLLITCDRLSRAALWIEDHIPLSIEYIRDTFIEAFGQQDLHKALIIIDYLQLMQPLDKSTENHMGETAGIIHGLKLLSLGLGVPIIVLVQLSRCVSGHDRHPALSNPHMPCAIEQDADTVILLDRSMNEQEAQEKNLPLLNAVDVIIAKHRNGPIGEVRLAFQPDCGRFDTAIPSWNKRRERVPEPAYDRPDASQDNWQPLKSWSKQLLYRHEPREHGWPCSNNTPSIPDIQTEVEYLFGISHEDMLSSKCDWRVSTARALAMYLSRHLTDESLVSIGNAFRGRDYLVVMDAVEEVEDARREDEELNEQIELLLSRMKVNA